MKLTPRRYMSWAANLSAVATIITLLASLAFFALGGLFGTISDVVSIVQLVMMIPLAAAVYAILRAETQRLSLAATLIGILGMLVATMCQILQVANVLTFDQVTRITLMAGGAIGLWLLLVNALIWRRGLMPRGSAWAGLLAGACYGLLVLGFWSSGPQNPLIYLGSLGIVVGYPVWAIRFGIYWQRVNIHR